MECLDVAQNCGTVVCDDNLVFGCDNLCRGSVFQRCARDPIFGLAILSMPLGPKDVRTTSLIAAQSSQNDAMCRISELVHTLRGDDVGVPRVFAFALRIADEARVLTD